jgi:hypothetical protein
MCPGWGEAAFRLGPSQLAQVVFNGDDLAIVRPIEAMATERNADQPTAWGSIGETSGVGRGWAHRFVR